MSDRLKSTNNVTNEDVIDDLTKDLELSLRTDDVTVSTSECGDDATHPNIIHSGDTTDKIGQGESDEEQSDKETTDTDSIDELMLKDIELDLTDEQKAERQTIAEELKNSGNNAFKVGEYELSIDKYTQALRTCPLQFDELRAILYCNRGAAKMKLEKYKQATIDCTKACDLDDKYIKAFYRRAQCYEVTNKVDECFEDYKRILELDPSHKEAQEAMIRLPLKIEERNEKLKGEMLGKLKDLGNIILKPFGLSTSNFQFEQDPETKGYKLHFNQ